MVCVRDFIKKELFLVIWKRGIYNICIWIFLLEFSFSY